MHCAECRWHHAPTEAHESIEWKHCYALPYPDVVVLYFRPEAECSFPTLFQSKADENLP